MKKKKKRERIYITQFNSLRNSWDHFTQKSYNWLYYCSFSCLCPKCPPSFIFRVCGGSWALRNIASVSAYSVSVSKLPLVISPPAKMAVHHWWSDGLADLSLALLDKCKRFSELHWGAKEKQILGFALLTTKFRDLQQNRQINQRQSINPKNNAKILGCRGYILIARRG